MKYKFVCADCGSDEVYATWEAPGLPINKEGKFELMDFLDGSFYMDYIECPNCEKDVNVEEVEVDETK